MLRNGVLFLDELPEFKRETLEVLRQPLEEGDITVARLQATYTYPARFMLLASMNPCPCGLLSDPAAACVCTPLQVQRYHHKISGPLLDRLDIFIEVPRLRFEEVTTTRVSEPSRSIKKRVEEAREKQRQRFNSDTVTCNAHMGSQHVQQYCALDAD
ncbi:MAG: ATP-binding protein [Dethiobacter sp.]|jgi:magnesium chelatase family protein|nr:ATP-binding protein [Dethiobacter sp.]